MTGSAPKLRLMTPLDYDPRAVVLTVRPLCTTPAYPPRYAALASAVEEAMPSIEALLSFALFAALSLAARLLRGDGHRE
jgi:hypothetical protein